MWGGGVGDRVTQLQCIGKYAPKTRTSGSWRQTSSRPNCRMVIIFLHANGDMGAGSVGLRNLQYNVRPDSYMLSKLQGRFRPTCGIEEFRCKMAKPKSCSLMWVKPVASHYAFWMRGGELEGREVRHGQGNTWRRWGGRVALVFKRLNVKQPNLSHYLLCLTTVKYTVTDLKALLNETREQEGWT